LYGLAGGLHKLELAGGARLGNSLTMVRNNLRPGAFTTS
jgi:hypothetical protein